MARFTSIGMPRKTFVASSAEDRSGSQGGSGPDSTDPSNVACSSGSGSKDGAPNDDGTPKKKTHRSGKRLKAKLQRQAAIAAGEMEPPKPTAPKVHEDGTVGKKNKGKRKAEDVDGHGLGQVQGPSQGWVERRRGGKEMGEEVGANGAGGGVGGGGGWGRDEGIAKRSKISSDRSEQRRIQRQEEKKASLTCFACRGTGHSARDCPNAGAEGAGNICYRCGSDQHRLQDCPKPRDASDPTPFASCYVCSSKGHIASQCPSNAKGIYVKGNGGKCKICSSVRHLVADCPELALREAKWKEEREAKEAAERDEKISGEVKKLGADEDDWMAESRVKIANGEIGQGQRAKKDKKPFNNNGLRRPYKEQEEMVGQQMEGVGGEGKAVKVKKAKVVAF